MKTATFEWQEYINDYRNEWGWRRVVIDRISNGDQRWSDVGDINRPVKTIKEREEEITEFNPGYDPFPKLLEACPRAIHQLDRIARNYNKIISQKVLNLDKLGKVVSLAFDTIEKYVSTSE
jgi:hypothetical protein